MKLRHRETLRTFTEAVVATVAVAGVLSVAAVAPNALLIFKGVRFGEKSYRRYFPQALRRAERRGLVEIRGGFRSPRRVYLTEKGRRLLMKRELDGLAVPRPRRWDGKWRVVVFDVPETEKRARDGIRKTLRRFGFVRLQESVWIYPFDCRDTITLLRTAYGFEHVTVRCLVTSELEEDAAFRRHFDV